MRVRHEGAVPADASGDMGTLVSALVLIALGVLILGSTGSRAVRRASRMVATMGFVVFAFIAVAGLYGMVRLGGRGGGVLLFIAIPAAIIAGLFSTAFRGSRSSEEFLELPVLDQGTRTRAGIVAEIAVQERVIAGHEAALDGIFLSTQKRERLRAELDLARVKLEALRRIRDGLNEAENDTGKERSIQPTNPRKDADS